MTTQETRDLGPAERIIQTLLQSTEHVYHGRPGFVVVDPSKPSGIRWSAASTRKVEGATHVVTPATRSKIRGQSRQEQFIGVLAPDGVQVLNPRGQPIGRLQKPGFVEEVAVWYYKSIAEVWKLNNEFAARWASYAYAQDHRDLKIALAAFMLVQSRRGDLIRDGAVSFRDADYREVGEAMLLLTDDKRLNPKQVLRVQQFLAVPAIAALNRELGFGQSTRRPFYGRWAPAVSKWLTYREDNPKMLEGLVKAGFRTSVQALVQKTAHVGGGWKPSSPKFYDTLRWKQVQAPAGHRTLQIGAEVKAAESWTGLSEREICERIESMRPNWKRVVGLLPAEVGVTRAIIAATLEAGGLSDKDLIILTPTLEELGLLDVPTVKARWTAATKAATDMRALHVAQNVRTQATRETLEASADKALQAAVEKAVKGIRVYVLIDISGSMSVSLDAAKAYLTKLVPAFPRDKLHVAVFNTVGAEIQIPHQSAAGVARALHGISAGGGTDYAAGPRALAHHKPAADEDALYLFIGDEENGGTFTRALQMHNLVPAAFGLVHVRSASGAWAQNDVKQTAAELQIPCFELREDMFDDPYAVPRTLRTLIDSTPVTAPVAVHAPRTTLIDTILKTPLLSPPVWA